MNLEVLGESVCRRHVVSTSCIVLGNTLILTWGDHSNHKITLDRLQAHVLKKKSTCFKIIALYTLDQCVLSLTFS